MAGKPNDDNEPREDSGYEVKDKRRFNADGTPREDVKEPDQPAQPEENPAEPRQGAKEAPPQEPGSTPSEAPPPNIYAVLQFIIGLLAEQAWILMGIRLAPGQKEMTKDLGQARVAIDTIVFLADKLHPHISDEERTAIRSLLSDLQINFVRQS